MRHHFEIFLTCDYLEVCKSHIKRYSWEYSGMEFSLLQFYLSWFICSLLCISNIPLILKSLGDFFKKPLRVDILLYTSYFFLFSRKWMVISGYWILHVLQRPSGDRWCCRRLPGNHLCISALMGEVRRDLAFLSKE